MKEKANTFLKTGLSLAGVAILVYLFYHVGIAKILLTLQKSQAEFLFIAVAITLFASAGRIYKLRILFSNLHNSEILEMYISMKLGKEMFFLGNFIPLVAKKYRNVGSAQKLLLERYFEVLSTMGFGFIAAFIVSLSSIQFYIYALILLFMILIMVLPVIFDGSSLLAKLHAPISWVGFTKKIRNTLKNSHELVWAIAIISILVTIFDFLSIQFIFMSVGLVVNPLFIPIVWAISGIVSMVTFLQIGTGEWSAVILYKIFLNVFEAGTVAMIVLHRTLSLFNLAIVFIYRLLMPSCDQLKEISIMLTNRCNSRCVNCKIWAIPLHERIDIDPSFVEKIPPLKKVTLTGGEPLLYGQLANVIINLARRKVKRIVITSNGLVPMALERLLLDIKEKNSEALKTLSFRFSYDAKGALNDALRGAGETENKLISSINIAHRHGIKDVGITQTCLDSNMTDVRQIYDFALEKGIHYGFQLAHASKSYFNKEGENRISDFGELRNQLNYILKRDLKSGNPRRWFRAFFHSYYFKRACGGAKRPAAYPCRAGKSYLFVTPKGEIKPCNFLENGFGEVSQTHLTIKPSNREQMANDLVENCSNKCWLICTANQEIKRNPLPSVIWILQAWTRLILSRDVL